MSGLAKILIAIFGGAVIGFVAYIIASIVASIVASLFHDLYDLTKPKTASKRNFLTADTVRRIAEPLVYEMRKYNQRVDAGERPTDVRYLWYVCGAEMVLLYVGVPHQFQQKNGRYTGLTLDGVTYPVTT